MSVHDPCCGSGGLLVKFESAMENRAEAENPAPLKLYGQEYTADTWAMANINVMIHDMEGQVEIGDTFKNPKFRDNRGNLRTFDRVVANPMWNQDWFTESDYDADELDRFPAGAGFPGKSSADWGWVQHKHASQIFEKGAPKNFIPESGIQRIADTLIGWKEEEKLTRIVKREELEKDDYNISPSRYIHTGDAETYRPIGDIVAELDAIEAEARETDRALRDILKKIGVGS